MKVLAPLLGLALAPLLLRPAVVEGAPLPPPATALQLDLQGGRTTTALPFHSESGRVRVEGQCIYDAQDQVIRLTGHYRTDQPADPGSFLSYQLYNGSGVCLLHDGHRFAWTRVDGGLEAAFDIEIGLSNLPPGTRTVGVQFNYVLERQFWYRDRYPAWALPRVVATHLPRADRFDVRFAFVPPFLPADTRCRLPARVVASYRSDAPTGYRAALDGRTIGGARVESVREALPELPGGKGVCWLWEEFPASFRGALQVRPGFVWDGVRWYSDYPHNPYRRVWLVGPGIFALVLAVLVVAIGLAWWRVGRISRPGLRRAAETVVALGALYLAIWLWVADYAVLAALAGLIWWVGRRCRPAGPRAYTVGLAFVLLLEVYWGHVCSQFADDWRGTLFSLSVAAIVLLPLWWVRRPRLAAVLVGTITLLATVVTIAMSAYFGFFRDYPAATALLYARQASDLTGSIAVLTGQAQLVPLLFWALVPLGLRGPRNNLAAV